MDHSPSADDSATSVSSDASASTAPGRGAAAKAQRAALVLLGVALAARQAWTCDDAFISYRYAQNLLDGKGLVFNAGEPVEGYTNFLWTIWAAVGLALGVAAETWSSLWGLVAFGAAIWLLGRLDRPGTLARPDGQAWPVPLAAMAAALCGPWQVWATGGLETSADATLLLAGWWTATRPGRGVRGAGLAGLILALATLTRPDGVLPAALLGASVLLRGPTGTPRPHGAGDGARTLRDWLDLPAAAAFSAAFAALWLPWTLWRVTFYGDLLPNTFYAKSAHLLWFDQGWSYVGLTLRELPWLGVAWLLGVGGLVGRLRAPTAIAAVLDDAGTTRRLLTAWSIATLYVVWVAKVGGDFMHTRLLIPTLPLLLVVGQLGLDVLLVGMAPAALRRARLLIAALVALSLLAVPKALPDGAIVDGITDEHSHYDPELVAQLEADAAEIRPFVQGLPVTMAFIGGQARLVYRLGVDPAVEAETGLTDAAIAHQPLERRGRVGHEKRGRPDDLVDRRHLHLVVGAWAFRYLQLDGQIPRVGVRLGRATVFLLTWDAALVAALRARGAEVPPFEEQARRLLADPSQIPAAQRVATLASIRRFWPQAPAAAAAP